MESKVTVSYIILSKIKGHINGNSIFGVIVNLENCRGELDSLRPGGFDRNVPRKLRVLRRGPCLPAGRKGHNIK
jgi:hypothetical protein